MDITWSVSLNKTAGRTYTSKRRKMGGEEIYISRIELSLKVIDEVGKLLFLL